jgi:hypothetical protein
MIVGVELGMGALFVVFGLIVGYEEALLGFKA